ncbi:probable myosin light chain kinase DDB_G0284661, partial [Condylostylus longicornis]|uniref:probable myosin light chain kinase DDB_G0284661 n=1 Tax=Condylostylus longicornis TaxID=2530218 RepID=UPI00244E5AF2
HPGAEILSVQPITSHFIKSSTFAPDDNKDFDLNPRYSFSYDIKDIKTGDDKQQEEKLSEGNVQGKYSLVEPDGTRRTVSYTANDLNGFNAIISKESPFNQNIIYESQKFLNIDFNRKDNQNLEEFQKQLAKHQIEIEEEQRRQQEEFRKSIIQQKEQLTKEQLKQTLIEQQEKLTAEKEQQRKLEQLVLSQRSSILNHAIHSTIIHHNTPSLEVNSSPILTTNQHFSTLQTHPGFIKSFGSSKTTQILSSHPTTLLQRQYFSSPSVEYASKINLHTTGLNSQKYHKLSEAINITIGDNLSNEQHSKYEDRNYNINDSNDNSETDDEGRYDQNSDENEYNRNDYGSDQRSKEITNGLNYNERELMVNANGDDDSK